jgi:hypothetical protein
LEGATTPEHDLWRNDHDRTCTVQWIRIQLQHINKVQPIAGVSECIRINPRFWLLALIGRTGENKAANTAVLIPVIALGLSTLF